jgi:hypothetical protein
MGTFAERASADYCCHFPTKENKRPFSVCIYIETYAAISNGKRKTEAQAIFLYSVYHVLIVQTEVCRLSVFL